MSSALMVQQDAIAGYWDIDHTDLLDPPGLKDPSQLDYLSDGRRQQILLAELMSPFRVRPTKEGAKLLIGAALVCELKKPAFADDPQCLKGQMQLVRGYSDLRADRVPEIQRQMDDIISFFEAAIPMNLRRRECTLHVLSVIHSLTILLEMQAKHHCWMARPSEYAHEVQPIIPTPDHSTYPSGHATEAFVLATVIHRLTTGERLAEAFKNDRSVPMVFRVAHRVAVNRTIAGVHFPVDSAAGAVFGCVLGETIADFVEIETTKLKNWRTPLLSLAPGHGEEPAFCAKSDFTLAWTKKHIIPKVGRLARLKYKPATFSRLWERAVEEWRPTAPEATSDGNPKAERKPGKKK